MKGNNIKYKCDYKNDNFGKICIVDKNGQYDSVYDCLDDCEPKYIDHQLSTATIKDEIYKFYKFVNNIIKNENMYVYIKGGNTIGMCVMKTIYDTHKNDPKKFIKCFSKFLSLELIKDWDFIAYTNKPITNSYKKHLNKLASKYGLVLRAKTFILYQSKKPVMLHGKPLFEIAIAEKESYSMMEIPMTTMKIKINKRNIKYIFMFAKSFLKYETDKSHFDYKIIKRMIKRIDIIIHPHKNGFYDASINFDKGNINDDLMGFLKKFSKGDIDIQQFIVTHLQDLFRMFYRMPEKNIPKSNLISQFYKNNLDNHKLPTWLLDTKKIHKIILSLSNSLGQKLKHIYNKNKLNNTDVSLNINNTLKFLEGVNFNRLHIEMKNNLISQENIKIMLLMIKPFIDAVGHDNMTNYTDNNKTVKFFKYVIKDIIKKN